MPEKAMTNIIVILADQLRAGSLPVYGEENISTPNIDRLSLEGVTFSNAVSSSPLCTPYRSMLLTGRHPQSTGHLVNNVCTRHDEISIADAFAKQGYRTGWVGKWHLHRGSFPGDMSADWVPAGRDRLGFDFWRGYNHHMIYFDGPIQKGDWLSEQPMHQKWRGYETEALGKYAAEFLDSLKEEPFLLFVSPHQPHPTPLKYAPDKYYKLLPENLKLPDGISDCRKEEVGQRNRDYLAMILALDEMVGDILDKLKDLGKEDETIVLLTSDHGCQFGFQDLPFQEKRSPFEQSIHVPLIVKYPGQFEKGGTSHTLTAPVDLFPTLALIGLTLPVDLRFLA